MQCCEKKEQADGARKAAGLVGRLAEGISEEKKLAKPEDVGVATLEFCDLCDGILKCQLTYNLDNNSRISCRDIWSRCIEPRNIRQPGTSHVLSTCVHTLNHTY